MAGEAEAAPKRVEGLGFRQFRVWGLGFGVWGLGFRVQGSGFRVPPPPPPPKAKALNHGGRGEIPLLRGTPCKRGFYSFGVRRGVPLC